MTGPLLLLTYTSLKEMHIVLCVVFVVTAVHHPEKCDIVTSTRVRVLYSRTAFLYVYPRSQRHDV